ncbi:MAG: hypothetical protein WDO12_04150 [Pseudomonadota bacterium]
MQRVSRLVLAAALFCEAVLAQSGEAASDAKPQPERKLLQPPVEEIASPITDRFAIRAVYFRPTVTTDLRYDNAAGNEGTTFGAARELGLQRTLSQGWLDMMMRVTPAQRIEAEFYKLTRSGNRVLADDIQFGDTTFQSGERLVTHTDQRMLQFTYLYSPIRRDTVELAIGLGIHLLQVTGELDAPASFKHEQVDTAGPVPLTGGGWNLALRPQVLAERHGAVPHHQPRPVQR